METHIMGGNAGTDFHRTLQQQILNGRQEAVEEMIAQGLPWKKELTPARRNPMHVALASRNTEKALLLLNIENLAHDRTDYGETPLHLACRRDLTKVVQRLLDMGVDINARDDEDFTPLFHAVDRNCFSSVELMIQAGCDLDAMNQYQMTSLDQVSSNMGGNIIVDLLLRAGCRVEKAEGYIYYKGHYSNCFFCSLWEFGDVKNMRLYLDCGYPLHSCEVSKYRKELSERKDKRRNRIVTGDQAFAFQIVENAIENPQALTVLCRVSIRRALMEKRQRCHTPLDTMIGSLPVPDMVKQFLMVKKSLP